MISSKFTLAVFILVAARMVVAAEPLFQNGRTDWTIHVSAHADPTELYAAQELHDALKRISGAEFEVSTNTAPEARAIIIGGLENPDVQAQSAALKLSPGKVEEVAVCTLGGRLYLAGNQPRGALYAVYSFLQRDLGVRWLWPGPSGEFMPAKSTWTVPELAYHHRPAFPYRGFHLCGDFYRGPDSEVFREWMARNFINIYRHAAPLHEKRRGFYSMWSSHNVSLPRSLFEQHPEYFAEVSGKRYAANICFSNPEVDALVVEKQSEYIRKHPHLDILSLFPSDTTVYCRCAKCATRDPSTVWFECYNRLTDALKKEFPKLKFAATAYFEYRAVPKCPIRNSEFVEYASYSRCNVHPYGQAGCKPNEDTMNAMLEWQATGLPIGNYAYEYDVFRKNPRFIPFLSLVDDAIKTGRKLGHVTMIPEVLLISPKYVPSEDYIYNVQNRLTIYLYARLLWEPDRKMTDILRDWCRTAFGEAADPMYGYYLDMDRAWAAMPIHTAILGDALSLAPHLLGGKRQEEAAAAFAAAEQRLPKIANPDARARAAAAIARERVLFKQWQDLYGMRAAAPPLILPLLAQPEDFARSASRPQEFGGAAPEAGSYATRVSLAWTKEALLAKWVCQDPGMQDPKAAASTRDGEAATNDSVELALASGLTDERWHFAINPKGVQQGYRESGLAAGADLWKPEWQAKIRRGTNVWTAEMTIPFATLGQTPNPKEIWQARFLRHNGGRRDFAGAVFPERETSPLFFSPAARAGRSLLWWHGRLDDVKGKSGNADAAAIQDFARVGWHLNSVTNGARLVALHGQCDAYWFRHPAGPNPVPGDYWESHLAPAVSNGALAVFVSYGAIPLERYFNDPSFKVQLKSVSGLPLAARQSRFIAPGDWSLKPNNLLSRLKGRITPAYGFEPQDAQAWTVLATTPLNDRETFPYLLARRYGKGLIILCGDSIPLSPADMLENFVRYHEALNESQEPGGCPLVGSPVQSVIPSRRFFHLLDQPVNAAPHLGLERKDRFLAYDRHPSGGNFLHGSLVAKPDDLPLGDLAFDAGSSNLGDLDADRAFQ